MKQQITIPEPINRLQVLYLIEKEKIEPSVARIDFEMVKAKFKEKKGWSEQQCNEEEVVIKRLLTLPKKYPDFDLIVPHNKLEKMDLFSETLAICNEEILHSRHWMINQKVHLNFPVQFPDILQKWYQRVLDTRTYYNGFNIAGVFGGYTNRFPYFGCKGEAGNKELLLAFKATEKLYKNEFGEEMPEVRLQSLPEDVIAKVLNSDPAWFDWSITLEEKRQMLYH